MTETVTVSVAPMTCAELLAIARGAELRMAPDALAAVDRSRAVIDQVLASGVAVYGLNTGLGHMKDTRLEGSELRRHQEVTVEMHDGGLGEPLAREVVRAAMAARVNGMARGGSGASRAVLDVLVAMLNAGVHPVVPAVGSVGASDLMHMAAIGMVAIGKGEAEYEGELLPGAEALRRAGVSPAQLEPKDGLTLVSANGVAVGHGALVLARLAKVADLADVVAALSLEAYQGNPSVFEAVVADAKGVPGQVTVAGHVRALLAGSYLYAEGGPRSIQDPLSFRVVPQVHGALRELERFAARAVEAELNAMTDNPLVSSAEGRMVHNGNFHPMLLALAFDAVRPALAHVAQLSDRRMEHLWGISFDDPEMFAPQRLDETVGTIRTGLTRYAAASLVAEVLQLAIPATLDCPPLDVATEDHATSAPLTVRRTDEALALVEQVLTAELMGARTALAIRGERPQLGAGTGAALAVVDEVSASVAPDGRPAQIHAAVWQAARGELLERAHAVLSSHGW